MDKASKFKQSLNAIEEELEAAMAELNESNTRIDGLLAGLDAGQTVEDVVGEATSAERADAESTGSDHGDGE